MLCFPVGAASPHGRRADGYLLQVTHGLGISTSHNPTSEDPNYHFKGENLPRENFPDTGAMGQFLFDCWGFTRMPLCFR